MKIMKSTVRILAKRPRDKAGKRTGYITLTECTPVHMYGLSKKEVTMLGKLIEDVEPSSPRGMEAMRRVVIRLNPDNPDHFTESGLPECKALESLCGGNITAADRDAAFVPAEIAEPQTNEKEGK